MYVICRKKIYIYIFIALSPWFFNCCCCCKLGLGDKNDKIKKNQNFCFHEKKLEKSNSLQS